MLYSAVKAYKERTFRKQNHSPFFFCFKREGDFHGELLELPQGDPGEVDFAAVVEASSSSRLISFGATGVSRNKSLELS